MKQDETLCLPGGIVMNGNQPGPWREKLGEDTRTKMVTALSLGAGPRVYFIQQIFMEQLRGPALFQALGALPLIALPLISQMCLMKMLLSNGEKKNVFFFLKKKLGYVSSITLTT